MELSGERSIPVPREIVWAALNDPEVLRACIPGCRTLTKTSDTEFAARVTSKIGPVSASFAGNVVLSEIDPMRSYIISANGQGGVAGFAKGRSRVTLTDQPDGGTLLTYTATAEIGGKLASLGSRLLEGASRKTADEFFSAFTTWLVADPEPEPSPARPLVPEEPHTGPPAIHVHVGDIRVVIEMPWTGLLAVGGWAVALGLAWHAFARKDSASGMREME